MATTGSKHTATVKMMVNQMYGCLRAFEAVPVRNVEKGSQGSFHPRDTVPVPLSIIGFSVEVLQEADYPSKTSRHCLRNQHFKIRLPSKFCFA